ncbi:dienelactone hydrolase family protein [Cellulomonas sp. P5_C5]
MSPPPFGWDDVDHDVALPGTSLPWPVHRVGVGPPVVVMHELFGMTEMYLSFCYRLADDGFTVWMPQLVGAFPSRTPVQRAAAVGAICISREIDVLRSGRRSPVVTPLRVLAQAVATEHGTGRVGVVGMCLTGGFALALAADPSVVAAVAAQPALPARPFCGRALGLSPGDVRDIRARLSRGEVEVYYTRFADDFISPRSRLKSAVETLDGGARVHTAQLPAAPFGVFDHAVLTAAPAKYADRKGSGAEHARVLLAAAATEVSDFLAARLTPV